jgi:transposase
MTRFVGLDVSQKMTVICVVDDAGRRLWRGQCPTVPEQITVLVRWHAGDDARIGIETGAMTPWLVHELRNLGLEVVCLDARHARAAFKMQINKTDQNDAGGLGVPIPKFLCTFCVCVECAVAEAFDGCEDGIGGFCPTERLGRGISDFDISGDRGFQFDYGSMRAALDLLLGQEREEALDLIDPG